MIELTGQTGELKQAIEDAFVGNARWERQFKFITALLNEVGIPAVSDDGIAYDLPDRVLMLQELAVIALASDERTAVGQALVKKVERLERENKILHDEIKYAGTAVR